MFKASYQGNPNPIALNYNEIGTVTLQLPQGPISDSYKIYLFVNIIDDTYGNTVYNLTYPVSVFPNDLLVVSLSASISSGDMNNPVFADLNSGNLNLVANNVISLTTAFNLQSIGGSSLSTLTSINSTSISTQANQMNNQIASLRDFMIAKVVDLAISDLSSIKVISSALSVASQTQYQVSAQSAVKFFLILLYLKSNKNIVDYFKGIIN